MRILIIGNLDGQIGTASKIAISKGAKISIVDNNEAGLAFLRDGKGADIILTDINNDIRYLSESLRNEHIHIQIIACGTGVNKVKAVEAIESGACEYISLPPDEKLILAVLESIAKSNTSIVGSSPTIKKAVDLAKVVANSDASILITGESGTGKEVFSQFIHSISNRGDKPFVSLNCAAIPENLLESELFGHEKGAFTGAIARRVGKFEEANGGTLLLDEISEIDLRLQSKLLRAIQEKEIERVGGNNKISLNIRIIATSNRDLQKFILEGKFREDLFFRLNVINLQLPPLRKRKEDIKEIASHFLKKYTSSNNMALKTLSPDALRFLEDYNWPGNIRELENVIYRAILLSRTDVIETSDFMLDSSHQDTTFTEQQLILSTLKYCRGDEVHAANILGISIASLKTRLDEYVNKQLTL
jgi:two-component system response regulator FlrC